jgi:hypothetical protein
MGHQEIVRVVRRALRRGDRKAAFTQRILGEVQQIEKTGLGTWLNNEEEMVGRIAHRMWHRITSRID